jgi:hypothetical protein
MVQNSVESSTRDIPATVIWRWDDEMSELRNMRSGLIVKPDKKECWYCGRTGHVKKQCWDRKKVAKKEQTRREHVAAKKMEQTMIKQQPEEEIWVEIPIYYEYDEPHNVMGTMNEEEGKDNDNNTRNSEMQSRESNREEDVTTTRRGRKVRKPKRMIEE